MNSLNLVYIEILAFTFLFLIAAAIIYLKTKKENDNSLNREHVTENFNLNQSTITENDNSPYTKVDQKLKIYVDDTIISFLGLENNNSYHCQFTNDWWNNEKKKYNLFTSEEVLSNYSQPAESKEAFLKLEIKCLPKKKGIYDLAQIYIVKNHIESKEKDMAVDLAYASYYGFDFFITWNFSGLTSPQKWKDIRLLNARLNLSTPEFITPLQLVSEKQYKKPH